MKGGTDLMRSARIAGLAVVVSLAVAGIGASQTADTPVELKDVSIERAFDGASVTVKTSGPAQYDAKLIDSPTRLVIDLSGATYSSSKSRWTSGVEPVKEVRGSQWRKGVARVVVEMTRSDVGYRIDETPTGLVVAVENSNGRSPETKLETAKSSNGTADGPKVAPKPVVVTAVKATETAKATEKVATAATSPEASADAPKAAPKPAVVAAAKPADKPVPVAVPVSKEPTAKDPAIKAPAAIAAATPVPVLIPASAPAAPSVSAARQMVAQAPTTPTPTPPTPPAAAPATGEKLISLDFKDADVVNLLRILAAESGRNIVAGDDVKGRVSISLKNVTWEQALDTILEVRALAKVERDSVIRIVSLDQLTKEKEAIARVEAAKRNA